LESFKLTGDRNSAESQAGLHVQHIFDVMVWGKDDGIRNKAIFVALHGTDHSCLRGSRLVVVYNADAAQQLHVVKIYMKSVKRRKSPGWRTANEIAISSPVTVSIGLLINGVLSTTFLVMRLSVTT
jgi:hypothetical protein